MYSQTRVLSIPVLITLLAAVAGQLSQAQTNLRILNDETISHYAAQLPELTQNETFTFVLHPGFDSVAAGDMWFISDKAIYLLDGFPKKLISRLEYARLENPKVEKGRIMVLMDYQRNVQLEVNVGGLKRVSKLADSYRQEALHQTKRLGKTEQQEFGKVIFDFIADAIAKTKRERAIVKPADESLPINNSAEDPSAARLTKLKKLYEQGLITKEQYDTAVRDELKK